MAHIKIKKGLDIPIEGKPEGKIQSVLADGREVLPSYLSLNLNPFTNIRCNLLVKVGDQVKIGQPICVDKACPGRMFVSPATGVIKEFRRGLKRRLLNIVIEADREEKEVLHPPMDVGRASKEEIIERLKLGGLFAHIRKRPFNFLADPQKTPRAIFVKAVESAPFAPPFEMQVEGWEQAFQVGLDALKGLTEGPVHLVYKKDCQFTPFTGAEGVEKHTVEGPHPVGNLSLHIHYLSPIKHPEEVIWTLNAHDVVGVGLMLLEGRYFTDRVISIAGPGVLPEKRGFYRVRAGYPIEELIAGRIQEGHQRLISGDVLTGQQVEPQDFLEFYHFGFCVVPESLKREFLHFFRLGTGKFTASGAYASGHLKGKEYNFTTNLHGEERAFVIGSPYDRVMPMAIPVMALIKAIMAEDYDLAEELGLLEVDAEDFALPTFVCPSKIEMVDIVSQGLQAHAQEVLE